MTPYAELPVRSGAPSASAWGVWGDDDRRGALNRLGPDRTVAAVASVRTGEVVPLDLGWQEIDPPLFGRPVLRRSVTPIGSARDETLSDWNPQAGSQWDGFGHVGEPGTGSYNGLPAHEHGIAHWARHGIVGRGLLIDLPRYWSCRGETRDPLRRGEIGADELRAAVADQGGPVRPGDLLLVRTGWLAAYRGLDRAGRAALATGAGESLGLAAGPAMSELLWDLQVAAVVADNPSLEAWPPPAVVAEGEPASLHRSLLVRLGIPIGELWDLDRLAERCAARGAYDVLCVSVPIALEQAVASPANAVAIL